MRRSACWSARRPPWRRAQCPCRGPLPAHVSPPHATPGDGNRNNFSPAPPHTLPRPTRPPDGASAPRSVPAARMSARGPPAAARRVYPIAAVPAAAPRGTDLRRGDRFEGRGAPLPGARRPWHVFAEPPRRRSTGMRTALGARGGPCGGRGRRRVCRGDTATPRRGRSRSAKIRGRPLDGGPGTCARAVGRRALRGRPGGVSGAVLGAWIARAAARHSRLCSRKTRLASTGHPNPSRKPHRRGNCKRGGVPGSRAKHNLIASNPQSSKCFLQLRQHAESRSGPAS